jgi:adenylate kinase
MGPPGSGKGTQATILAADYGLTHVSTGEILRAAVRSGSELGHKVEAVLAAGELVTDDLMMDLMRETLAEVDVANGGWLLDGFPRTARQAEGLVGILEDLGHEAPLIIDIVVPDEEIVERLSGRLTCDRDSHVTAKGAAREGDKCPECDGTLYIRADDKPETVRNRLAVFREKTEPAKDEMARHWNVVQLDGLGRPEDVTQRIAGVIKAAH